MNEGAPGATCEQAWERFASKQLEQWWGIPQPCTSEDFFAVFTPLDEDGAVGKLGSEFIPTFYKVCSVTAYAEPVHVWFRDTEIVKIEVNYPHLSDERFASLLASLGQPVAKLDYYFHTFSISRGEWVYPARGIALFLNGDESGLVKWSLFHASTLDDYTRRIRPPYTPAREFPLEER